MVKQVAIDNNSIGLECIGCKSLIWNVSWRLSTYFPVVRVCVGIWNAFLARFGAPIPFPVCSVWFRVLTPSLPPHHCTDRPEGNNSTFAYFPFKSVRVLLINALCPMENLRPVLVRYFAIRSPFHSTPLQFSISATVLHSALLHFFFAQNKCIGCRAFTDGRFYMKFFTTPSNRKLST